MTKSKHTISLFFLLLFALLSTEVLSSNSIIPLKVGNYWKFSASNGKTEYARILEKKSFSGDKEWFKYRELTDDSIYFVSDSQAGQIEIDPESHQVHLVLKYPVTEKTVYTQFGVETSVTPNIEVTVPAGTFKTYLYDFSVSHPEDPILVWIAPNIGLVKSSYEGVTYELVEFNIQ